MHETAQASIFVNPGGSIRRSPQFGATTEDSHAPILQYDASTAGVVHQYGGDDGSFEDAYDSEQLVMRTPYTHDNLSGGVYPGTKI
jgi:hypothetical protein